MNKSIAASIVAMDAWAETEKGKKTLAIIADRRKRGLHAPTPVLCSGCREMVDGHWWITEDGRRMCRRCAEEAGHG